MIMVLALAADCLGQDNPPIARPPPAVVSRHLPGTRAVTRTRRRVKTHTPPEVSLHTDSPEATAALDGSPLASGQCQSEVAAYRGGWILITWCLARSVGAAFGLACMRFVGIR